MGPDKKFLTRVRSGQPSLVWVRHFCPSSQKNLIGLRQSRIILFTAGQKYAGVRAHLCYYPDWGYLVDFFLQSGLKNCRCGLGINPTTLDLSSSQLLFLLCFSVVKDFKHLWFSIILHGRNICNILNVWIGYKKLIWNILLSKEIYHSKHKMATLSYGRLRFWLFCLKIGLA